jgi:predicted Zn-dependent protease with MMP-like domain
VKLPRQTFCELVDRALAELPPQFDEHLQDLSVDVEDRPDPQTLRSLGLPHPWTLLGLYQGHPLTERSVEQPARFPDRIVIYQRNVERICRNRAEIIRQVRKTVLHEIGHHFGLSEDDLDELGYG